MASESLPRVAYFCMEYALQNDFKTYAGGLGILAGDYLKGAKDHGFPIVGIGIKWKQGYTDQIIGRDGRPVDMRQSRTGTRRYTGKLTELFYAATNAP